MRFCFLSLVLVVVSGCPTAAVPDASVSGDASMDASICFDCDASSICFDCDGGGGFDGSMPDASHRIDAGPIVDGVLVQSDGGPVCSNAVTVFANAAECTARSCSDGCCDGARCIRTCAQTYEQCGVFGQACRGCPASATCADGFCRGPGPCTGCRNGDVCIDTPLNSLCAVGSGPSCSLTLCEQCTPNGCRTTAARVGDPCASDVDCLSMGRGAFCRLTTTSGTTYPGGFCTIRCAGTYAVCPSSGECVEFPTRYGEADRLCVPNCNQRGDAGPGCRAGYECYPGLAWNGPSACWISPRPANVVTAPIGSACLVDDDCGAGRRCLRLDFSSGMSNGYYSGYCTSDCTRGAACGDGNDVCIGEQFSTPVGPATVTSCKASCSAPGFQGECRRGYVCQPSVDGNWCAPPCSFRTCGSDRCDFSSGVCSSVTP